MQGVQPLTGSLRGDPSEATLLFEVHVSGAIVDPLAYLP